MRDFLAEVFGKNPLPMGWGDGDGGSPKRGDVEMPRGKAVAAVPSLDVEGQSQSLDRSPRERFTSLAGKRTRNLIEGFRVLGHCSSRSSYEYTPEDVKKIFSKLQEVLDKTQQLFEGGVQKGESFEI